MHQNKDYRDRGARWRIG